MTKHMFEPASRWHGTVGPRTWELREKDVAVWVNPRSAWDDEEGVRHFVPVFHREFTDAGHNCGNLNRALCDELPKRTGIALMEFAWEAECVRAAAGEHRQVLFCVNCCSKEVR